MAIENVGRLFGGRHGGFSREHDARRSRRRTKHVCWQLTFSITVAGVVIFVFFPSIAYALSTRVHPTSSSSPTNNFSSKNLIAKSSSLSPPTSSTRRFRSRPVEVVIRDDTGQRVDQSPALPFTLGGNAESGDVDGMNLVDPSRKPPTSSTFAQRMRVDSGSRVLLFCETKDERVAYLAWNDRSGRELFGSVARFSDGLLQNELRLILRAGNTAFYPNTHEQDYICRAMDQHFNVLGLAVVQYHVVALNEQVHQKKAGGKTDKKLLRTSTTTTLTTPTTQMTKIKPEKPISGKEKRILASAAPPTQKLPTKNDQIIASPPSPTKSVAASPPILPVFVEIVKKQDFPPTTKPTPFDHHQQKSWIPPSMASSMVHHHNNNRATNQNGVMGSPLPYHQHQHFNIDNANVLHSYAHEEPVSSSSQQPSKQHPPHTPYYSAAESSAHQDFMVPPMLIPPHLPPLPPHLLPTPPHIITVNTDNNNQHKGPVQFYHEHSYETDRPSSPGVLPPVAAQPPPPPQLPPLPTFPQLDSTPTSPPKFFPPATTPTPLPMEPSSLPPLRLPIQPNPSSPFAANDELVVVTSTPVINFFIPTMAPSSENNKNFYATSATTPSVVVPDRSSKTLSAADAHVQVNIIEGNATVMVDHDVTLNCYATVTGKGSAPAIITWWLGSSLIRNAPPGNSSSSASSTLLANFETTSDIIVNNGDKSNHNTTITTRGRLKFKATHSLHDEKIWCRAISALVQSPTMSADESRKLAAEMAVVLNVVFAPLVQAGNTSSSSVLTKEDANVSLPCYMRANPPIEVIRWYKNARLIVEEELTLAQLGSANHDNYLSLHPSSATTAAAPTTRKFSGAPSTASSSTANWMMPGGGATTPSPASGTFGGYGNLQVAWLEMSSLQRDDIGAYACQAKNALGWGARSEPLELVIQYKPGAARPHEHATIDAAPGDTVTLKCDVADVGNPPSNDFMWRKDGKFVGRGATFVVKNAGAWDFGTYSCAAHNTVGEGKAAFIKLRPKDELNLISDPAVSSAGIGGDSASSSSSTSSLARKIFFFHQAETTVIFLAGIFALLGLIVLLAVIIWCICRSINRGRGCWWCCGTTTAGTRRAKKTTKHHPHHHHNRYETNHNNANNRCCALGAAADSTDSEHSRATPPPAAAAVVVSARSHSNSTSPSKLSDTESAIFPKTVNNNNNTLQRPNANLLLPWTYHPHMLPRAHLASSSNNNNNAAAAGMFYDNKHFTDGSRESSPVQQRRTTTANVSVHHNHHHHHHQPLAQTSEQHVHDIINLDHHGRNRQSRRSSSQHQYTGAETATANSTTNSKQPQQKPQKKRYFASSSRNVNKITLTGGGTSAAATVMKSHHITASAATTESTLASAYSSPRSLTNYQPCWLVNNNANGNINMSPTVTRSVKRFSEDDDNNNGNNNFSSSQIIGGLQRSSLVAGTSPWDWKSYRY